MQILTVLQGLLSNFFMWQNLNLKLFSKHFSYSNKNLKVN